jgi:transposase-like protein/transposase Tn5 family protein
MSLDDRQGSREWAYATFGGVEAGNRRRTRRVVAMAAAVARRPGGRVTDVFDDPAGREGAYRLLSNDAVGREALTEAMCNATAQQCASQSRVYVAIDGSSLSLRDPKAIRGLGGVGAWKDYGRGLHVMTALALDAQGVAIGVCAQSWWARTERSPKRRPSRRKLETKETRFARSTWDDAQQRLRELAPNTAAIGVMDRGFDCWPVLQTAEQGARFIVRARSSRRLADGPRGGRRYLIPTLQSEPVRGRYRVDVPAQPGRSARQATLQVQTARVSVELRVTKRKRQTIELNAVLAREVGGPRGASLSWMLLTTESVDTFGQVLDIIGAYTLRWRIEEMHRAWKRGGGNVEETQLRSRQAIEKWATLHCAVAARALRLTQLARTEPERPATEEFTQDEIDAAIVLRGKRTTLRLGDRPSLGELVRMIADLGGYTGKSSGGPPGPTVIGRGLERVKVAATVVKTLRPKKKPRKVTNG